jgi:hypothetical protein
MYFDLELVEISPGLMLSRQLPERSLKTSFLTLTGYRVWEGWPRGKDTLSALRYGGVIC